MRAIRRANASVAAMRAASSKSSHTADALCGTSFWSNSSRFSCMAALPARRRFEAFGESVDEPAQPKQIGETADTSDKVIGVGWRKPLDCLPIPIRPRRRNQRAAAVGQNGQEVVNAAPPEIADYGQRLALERMALAPDRHGRRNVMAMGSLRPPISNSIPHDRLLARIEEKVSDGRVLDLIRGWLKADILKGLERWTPTRGSPQGAVISPLLANIYLDPLDAAMAERGRRMVRFADDFVILCRTREEADAALAEVRAWVSENGLALHPDKTHVGDCRQPGQGFEFLGYRFEAGQRHVRQKSLNKFKDSIRGKTRRTRGDSLACAVADLNPLLRGWFGYFKHAHHTTFGKLDGFVRRRLRAILRKQEKRPGQGVCRADHQRWPNAFFAEAGLFALHTAWLSARQSR